MMGNAWKLVLLFFRRPQFTIKEFIKERFLKVLVLYSESYCLSVLIPIFYLQSQKKDTLPFFPLLCHHSYSVMALTCSSILPFCCQNPSVMLSVSIIILMVLSWRTIVSCFVLCVIKIYSVSAIGYFIIFNDTNFIIFKTQYLITS